MERSKIEEIILKKLITTDDYQFIYDESHVSHSDMSKLNMFFCEVQHEVKKKINVNVSEKDLKNTWYNMRKKFVKINLKKAENKSVSPAAEQFYQKLIFLEDFISHKNCEVAKTRNKKEILESVYNKLMNHTFAEEVDIDKGVEAESNLENLDSSILLSDTEDLQFLEEEKDIVYELLAKEKKGQEKKIIKKPMIFERNENKKNKELIDMRVRNENLEKNYNNRVIEECLSILTAIVCDYKDDIVKRMCVDYIMEKIEKFIQEHDT